MKSTGVNSHGIVSMQKGPHHQIEPPVGEQLQGSQVLLTDRLLLVELDVGEETGAEYAQQVAS